MSQPAVIHGRRLAAALLAACLALPAVAQGEDDGIAIGSGRLHPFLELEGRYDSNVLFNPDTGNVEGDLILHFRPGLELQVPGDAFAVDLNGKFDWAQYTGLLAPGTPSALSRGFGEANLNLGVNRSGQVGLEVTEAFHRSDQPAVMNLPEAVVSNFNDLQLKLPIRPGGGALIVNVDGGWQLETFEPYLGGCPASAGACPQPSIWSYNNFVGGADARWKFLPRTAIVLEASYFTHQPFDTANNVAVSGLRAQTGLAGLISPHIAATLKGGYGDTFGSAGVPYRTWLANAELEYIISRDVGSFRLGYVHNYEAAPGTDRALYGFHRVYAEGKMLIGGRVTPHLGVDFDYLGYVRAPSSTTVLHVEPSVDVEIVKWIYANVGYAYTTRADDLFSFNKNEVWLRATFIY